MIAPRSKNLLAASMGVPAAAWLLAALVACLVAETSADVPVVRQLLKRLIPQQEAQFVAVDATAADRRRFVLELIPIPAGESDLTGFFEISLAPCGAGLAPLRNVLFRSCNRFCKGSQA